LPSQASLPPRGHTTAAVSRTASTPGAGPAPRRWSREPRNVGAHRSRLPGPPTPRSACLPKVLDLVPEAVL